MPVSADADGFVEMRGPGVELASEIDRAWFEHHPGESVYVRPPLEGEWGDGVSLLVCDFVEVTQLAVGARVRKPCNVFSSLEPEAGNAILFDASCFEQPLS